MDPVDSMKAALAVAGYATGPATLDGQRAMIGRKSDFRLRWMATRVHTFVFATRFDPPPGEVAPLDRFLDLASQYAIKNKGGLPRGLQTGTAAVVVAIVDHATPAVVEWAHHLRGRRYGALTYPIAAETSTGTVIHPHRMVLGAIYNSHLRSIADEIVASAISEPGGS